MTDLREADDISTGELLDGRYQLEQRIGEGGMARVYRARDTHLSRTIAVKILRTPLDGSDLLDRARAETRVLASLSHHSVVTVFDARISDEDGSYIVMEYVDGITLRDLIREGPIDERDVARIAVDVAEGLHVAHSAGIVHRDVKPSNVLLGPSPLPGSTWHAKLADFGIAFLLDTTRVTTPGLVVGTAAYIAPEQAQGAAPAPPADVYAFGIVLIEALTGTRPYADAEGIGAVVARLVNPPTIPDSLTAEWQGLLRGMTATRPDDRPTALEVATVTARLAAAPEPASLDRPTEAFSLHTQPTMALPPIAAAGALGAAGTGALAGAAEADAPAEATGPRTANARPRGAEPVATVGNAGASAPVEPAPTRDPVRAPESDARRRRGIIAAIVAAAVLAVALAAAVWTMSLADAAPDPDPTAPAVVPSVVPSDAPSQDPAPAVVDDDGEDDSGETDDNGNSGSGSETSGNGDENPGNGNGNGNGGGGNGNQGGGNGGNGNGNQGNQGRGGND